jgi:monoamine oxidase
MMATRSRPWRDASLLGLNSPVNGTIYSDRGFQVVWDTSAGQEGSGGVLTNFLADEAAMSEEAEAAARMQEGLRAFSPALADALMPDLRASFFWPRHPHTLGSYSAAKVGQYAGLFEHAAASALEGTLVFAGEHTSVEGYGFMNGAVDAGERAAAELLA